MFLFLRLVLAHFVADFVLQTDEVYAEKTKDLYGAHIHYIIIFSTLVAFSIPYLDYSGCWFVIGLASLSHMIQDEIKIRHTVSKRMTFPAFLADQILHIAFLLPVFYFSFSRIVPEAKGIVSVVYNNNSFVIFSIGLIMSTLMGAYLWEAFRISYFDDPGPINPFRLKYGVFERLIITIAFLNFKYLLFLLIPLCFRLIKRSLNSYPAIIFNLLYASIIGLLLKDFLPIF